MTKPQTKRKKPKEERRSASITFRTTMVLKGLAARLAASEARSLGNYLEHLIRRECQRSLVFADERAAAETLKSDTLAGAGRP